MRIRADRDVLADALLRASCAVGTRSPLPILQGLHLAAVGSASLTVTGTDLENTVRVETSVEVIEPGSTVAPARLLAEATQRLPSGAVVLVAAGGEIEITGGGPRFIFRELSTEEFPDIEGIESESISIQAPYLYAAIKQVASALGDDPYDIRPILQSVFFEPMDKGTTRLVATDGYRLAIRDLAAQLVSEPVLVHGRSLSVLQKVMATRVGGEQVHSGVVRMGQVGRDCWFETDLARVTTRTVEGTFPGYRRLLPSSDGAVGVLTAPRGTFLEALGRARVMARDTHPVALQLDSTGCSLSVPRNDRGEAHQILDASWTGQDLTVMYNRRYLSDGVSAIRDATTEMRVFGRLNPALLRGADDPSFLYLLMPISP